MLSQIKTKKSILFLMSIVMLTGFAVFGSYNYIFSSDDIAYVKGTFATDLRDDRKLAGIANNIFIGKVISEVGDKKLDVIPETQFNVQVIENIKGSLNEDITVNQLGGKEDKKIVLVENDKMIEPGKVYLFATRYNEAENWHTLIPTYGDIALDNDTKKKESVEKYKKAYKEQVEFSPKQSAEK